MSVWLDFWLNLRERWVESETLGGRNTDEHVSMDDVERSGVRNLHHRHQPIRRLRQNIQRECPSNRQVNTFSASNDCVSEM